MNSPNGGASDWTGVTPHFAVGDVVARRYRIEKLVRQDVFGSVYLARHVRYGQAIALKVFHPFHFSSDDEFERVRTHFNEVKGLRHAGTARYLEVGEVDNHRYITMDVVDGKSLRQLLNEYLQAGQVLTLSEARRFILQILGILQSIGLSHGNLTPENIIVPARIRPGLMGETSDIRLMDFAFVEVNPMAAGDLQLAPPEEVAYTAPELIARGGAPSPSMDVYSVAAIFYEMLTGRKPVGEAPEMPSTLRPDVPEEFDFFLQACLNPNPNERLYSISEMESRLSNLSDDPAAHGEIKSHQRSASLVLAAILAIVAVIAVLTVTQDEELDPVTEINQKTIRLLNKARRGAVEDPPELLKARVNAAPNGMAYIPAGKFVRGYLPDERLASAKNQERLLSGLESEGEIIRLDGFYIDRYDAPNQVKAKPKGDVSWDEAVKACESEGKRLCTSDEWERACRGDQSDIYPYGMLFDPTKCPPSKKSSYSLGEYPGCISNFKVRDMAGGTWEWTATASPEGDYGHIIKGGFPGSDKAGQRCAFLHQENNEASYSYLSYRCCMDLPKEQAKEDPGK